MSDFPHSNGPESDVDRQAADWTVRIDRGLTPEEQDEYTQWLVSDPKHGEAIARHQWSWGELDRLAGLQTTLQARVDPDLLDPARQTSRFWRRSGVWRSILPAVALAACLAVAFLAWRFDSSPARQTRRASAPVPALIARIEKMELPDGSIVQLNRGAVVKPEFTDSERRIKLVKGEAHFDVAKNPDWPFIVEVAGVGVRAVGTMFNVKYTDEEVDIVVTEGKVSVDTPKAEAKRIEKPETPFLKVGQRAVVKLMDDLKMEVSDLSAKELDDALLWKPRLLDFDSAPLSAIVAEFNKSNPVTLVIGDESLRNLRLSSSFWSDNVEGFVRLMESSFGMSADWSNDHTIVLHRAKRG